MTNRLPWMSRLLALTGAIALTGAYASGCKESESEFFIKGVASFQGTCTAQAQADQILLFEGVLDATFQRDYNAALLFGNQLAQVDRVPDEKIRTETSRIVVQSAEVSIEVPDDSGEVRLVKSYSVPVSGFANPTRSGEPGYGLVSVPLVDAATGIQLAATGRPIKVNSKVKLYGRSLGGDDVHSNEFNFVVTICRGCLVSYDPTLNDAGAASSPNCLLPSTSAPSAVPCQIGQDSPVPCALCISTNAYCQCANPTSANGVLSCQ